VPDNIICLFALIMLAYNQRGNTPLHWAASGGHEEVCKYLISEAGADVCKEDNVRKRRMSKQG
jgi:Ankyrin repeat